MTHFIVSNNIAKMRAIEAVIDLDCDKNMVITIEPPNRSKAQNRLYWMWVSIIGKDTGHTKTEMHFVLANMFLPRVKFAFHGKQYDMPASTSDLSTKDFADYLKDIESFATDMGLNLPHPQDYDYIFNYGGTGVQRGNCTPTPPDRSGFSPSSRPVTPNSTHATHQERTQL